MTLKLEQTLYDVLEVSKRASPIVVKAAYRALAQSLHPDKNLGTKTSCERLVEINDAYSVLSDPLRRMNYDRKLRSTRGMVERRSANNKSGGVDLGHYSAGLNITRPFAFRPFN